MVRVKLDLENVGYSTIFEKITRTHARDSFPTDDTLFFVVNPGFLGKALGKGATNIRTLQQRLNKKIRIIEYSSSSQTFVERLIYPLKVERIEDREDAIVICETQKTTKGKIIGRGGANLKIFSEIVSRFFGKELKVE
jgi:transcription termination/antitermination protein NusA